MITTYNQFFHLTESSREVRRLSGNRHPKAKQHYPMSIIIENIFLSAKFVNKFLLHWQSTRVFGDRDFFICINASYLPFLLHPTLSFKTLQQIKSSMHYRFKSFGGVYHLLRQRVNFTLGMKIFFLKFMIIITAITKLITATMSLQLLMP